MRSRTTRKPSAQARKEIAGALAALKRARIRAEEIAAATGTMLIEAVDGKPIRVKPRQGLKTPAE
jgi:hypothetical protein